MAGLLAVVLVGPATEPAAAAARRCAPRGHQRVWVEGTRLVVLRPPDIAQATVSCDKRTGHREAINVEHYEYVFPPPAITVRGSLVAFGGVGYGEGLEASSSFVAVYRSDGRRLTRRYGSAFEAGLGTPKISVTKLAASGSIAWLACPQSLARDALADFRTGRRATCRHLGDDVYVFRHLVGGPDEPQLLAHSRRIDPRSFRLTGSKLSWRQDGRVVTRTLR